LGLAALALALVFAASLLFKSRWTPAESGLLLTAIYLFDCLLQNSHNRRPLPSVSPHRPAQLTCLLPGLYHLAATLGLCVDGRRRSHLDLTMMHSFSRHGCSSLALQALLLISSPLLALADTTVACAAAAVQADYPAPLLAPGFSARLVANGFHLPRSLVFDSAGHLLMLEQSIGVSVLTLNDAGGDCVSVTKKNTIIANYTVSSHRRPFEHC
jgi:hypothetical protein